MSVFQFVMNINLDWGTLVNIVTICRCIKTNRIDQSGPSSNAWCPCKKREIWIQRGEAM